MMEGEIMWWIYWYQ